MRPEGRTTLAITSLADGEKRYQNNIYGRTTTRMTADEIHKLGLREIDRIEAEMSVIAKKEGFADLAAFRASLKTNPKYMPTSAEQILDDFRRYIAQMEPKLPRLVHAVAQVAGYGRSDSGFSGRRRDALRYGHAGRQAAGTGSGGHLPLCGPLAGRRRSRCVPRRRPRPPHAAFGAATNLTGLPKFRQHSLGFNAYVEGWALYSEQLGKEVGFYQDPVSDYGRLSSELFRAVRLVVDTGIHSKGWTREQVVEFFRKSGAVDEPTIQTETDRYISWPAQALSYKLGQLKFRELRDRAQKKLGAKFDIRKFHDEMLDGGILPLDMLDARTDQWIAEQSK